jgi:MoxR-like ATPase
MLRFIKRRGYVIPEDVRAVHDVLRHRRELPTRQKQKTSPQ